MEWLLGFHYGWCCHLFTEFNTKDVIPVDNCSRVLFGKWVDLNISISDMSLVGKKIIVIASSKEGALACIPRKHLVNSYIH